MDTQCSTLMKVLLNAFHPGQPNAICRFMPEDEAEPIIQNMTDIKDFRYGFKKPIDWFTQMHYSWIAPGVQLFPSHVRPAIAAALPAAQASYLRHLLALEKVELPSAPARKYLLNQLYQALKLHDVTPLELIPESRFKKLCSWDKLHLCKLIDFLSMHDLAEKLRHIVDRKRLHDIYSCLSKEKLEYLRLCMHQKERLVSSEIVLDNWKGDPKELEHLLHKRGLIRFGKAISNEPKDVLWHILHRLDTGRSAIIENSMQNPAAPAVTESLAKQVEDIIAYIEGKDTREQ